MLVYRKLTEKNKSYKPTGRDNYEDIFANIKQIQQILDYMYKGVKEAKNKSMYGKKLDKVVPLVHKIHLAATDALTEFNYQARSVF